jgi:tRNA pseudouridine32 synthase / 23S rRNA pseudouridine746 synthase
MERCPPEPAGFFMRPNLDPEHDADHVEPGLPADVILHSDTQLLVLNKPSGLLSVPAKPPGCQDCLETRARAAFPGALLVHRLDMDTSGLMVFARTRLAQRHLGWQFERRQIAKTYIARVAGHLPEDEGVVDLPLICDWPNRPRQMVSFERGKEAVTEWRVLAREPDATRVELKPRTGRSHQLRVHMLALGHPILGDGFYAHSEARAAADRLQLHALRLGMRHPDGGAWTEFEAPVPF